MKNYSPPPGLGRGVGFLFFYLCRIEARCPTGHGVGGGFLPCGRNSTAASHAPRPSAHTPPILEESPARAGADRMDCKA